MSRDEFDVDSLEAKAFFRCKRALAHLMNKNHELAPLECAGCLEIAGFLTEPGYHGDEGNPVGVDGDVPL
jgi:hypothetical protein